MKSCTILSVRSDILILLQSYFLIGWPKWKIAFTTFTLVCPKLNYLVIRSWAVFLIFRPGNTGIVQAHNTKLRPAQSDLTVTFNTHSRLLRFSVAFEIFVSEFLRSQKTLTHFHQRVKENLSLSLSLALCDCACVWLWLRTSFSHRAWKN